MYVLVGFVFVNSLVTLKSLKDRMSVTDWNMAKCLLQLSDL